MATKQEKQQTLKKLRPQTCQIHGIFNFKTKKLVFVSLEQEEVELRFELEDYNDDYDTICINVALLSNG